MKGQEIMMGCKVRASRDSSVSKCLFNMPLLGGEGGEGEGVGECMYVSMNTGVVGLPEYVPPTRATITTLIVQH